MVHKRKTRNDIVEEYWFDFLHYCFKVAERNQRNLRNNLDLDKRELIYPTVDNFWAWYITEGPFGQKHANRVYSGGGAGF